MKYLVALTALFFCISSYGQPKNETAILKVLATQAAAWNAGNIHDYMKGYWNNDSLLFIGSKGPTYGYQNTLDRYIHSYQDTVKMGKLHFSNISMKKLSGKYYFVSGKWALTRSIGNLEGYFTLLFRKIHGKWLIIADHSS